MPSLLYLSSPPPSLFLYCLTHDLSCYSIVACCHWGNYPLQKFTKCPELLRRKKSIYLKIGITDLNICQVLREKCRRQLGFSEEYLQFFPNDLQKFFSPSGTQTKLIQFLEEKEEISFVFEIKQKVLPDAYRRIVKGTHIFYIGSQGHSNSKAMFARIWIRPLNCSLLSSKL